MKILWIFYFEKALWGGDADKANYFLTELSDKKKTLTIIH